MISNMAVGQLPQCVDTINSRNVLSWVLEGGWEGETPAKWTLGIQHSKSISLIVGGIG